MSEGGSPHSQPAIDGTADARPSGFRLLALPFLRLRGIGSPIWRALDLWGFTRSDNVLLLALLVTGCFVLLEAHYNLELLNTIIDPAASRESVQALSNRGKFLASFGLAWAVGRFLLERIRPALLGVLLLAALVAGIYQGLDRIYTKVINDLPPEIKLKGLGLFGYRQELLAGRLSDPNIPLPEDEPIEGRIIMGSFPIVLIDDHYMIPASDVVTRKVGDGIRGATDQADAQWPAYNRQMLGLRKSHFEFLEASRQLAQLPSGSPAAAALRQSLGDMTPNTSMTLEQFAEHVRASDTPAGKAMRDAEAATIAVERDGTPLKMSEVPMFMTHEQYLQWFGGRARKALAPMQQTVETIEHMEGINDLNAGVFLPPMAMIASLTSALANGINFILLASMLALQNAPSAGAKHAGRWMSRYNSLLMLALCAALLLTMPTYVFKPGPMRDLEQMMHERVGVAGYAWSRLSNLQSLILRPSK